jgi:hypothetical protein
MELIRSRNIYIYMILEDGEVKSAYFYRKTCTFIREKCEALCCFASINCFSKRETDIFIHGYKVALWKICEQAGFKFAVVEEMSDNYQYWIEMEYASSELRDELACLEYQQWLDSKNDLEVSYLENQTFEG